MIKTGDWVRVKETTLIFKCRLWDKGNSTYAGHQYEDSTEVKLEDCELWEPRESEWCWFHDENSFSTIGQYGATNGATKHCMKSRPLDLWDSVEPFIGELPSFIKKK